MNLKTIQKNYSLVTFLSNQTLSHQHNLLCKLSPDTTGRAITYGNLQEIGSRLQTNTGTVILRPFLKFPDFLHLKKYKK